MHDRASRGGIWKAPQRCDYPECLCPIMLPAGTAALLLSINCKWPWAIRGACFDVPDCQWGKCAGSQSSPLCFATIETTPVYYLFSKLMDFIITRCLVAAVAGGGVRRGGNMINNWYAVWESWFATSPLVHLSLAVVRTHLLWWEIWRSAQQHHIWLEI